MRVDLKTPPMITTDDPMEAVGQLQRYMFELVEQINFYMSLIDESACVERDSNQITGNNTLM